MAFDSLSDKLQNIFKNLRGKGRLSEADVKAALKEVKMALLEADVNFKVVKNFIKSVEERAIGQDVMSSLTPGQMVIKIVNEEMISLMGSETTEIAIKPGNEITVIMMAGLQGAGKTTTTAKLAGKFKAKGKKPLLVACDVYRPAAIEQLTINGNKQGVEVFSMGTGHNPVDIAKASIAHAKENNYNIVILDTAGRLHIDENMMDELINIKSEVNVDQTILVVDSMTGQDAVNVASSFNEKVGIDGVILTKLDGEVVQHFQLRLSQVSLFFMLVWERNCQTLNSSILIVWHQEFLEWVMFLHSLRRLRHRLMQIKPKRWKLRLKKLNLILTISLNIWDRFVIWVV